MGEVSEAPVVRPGQIWQDNDPRSHGRFLRVIHLTETHAVCGPRDPKVRGRATRIRLDRFKPTSTGYRLVEDASEEAGGG